MHPALLLSSSSFPRLWLWLAAMRFSRDPPAQSADRAPARLSADRRTGGAIDRLNRRSLRTGFRWNQNKFPFQQFEPDLMTVPVIVGFDCANRPATAAKHKGLMVPGLYRSGLQRRNKSRQQLGGAPMSQ